MNAKKLTLENTIAALEDMLPLALAHLQHLTEDMPSKGDDTDDHLPAPEKWELSRQYYHARNLVEQAKSLLEACR